MSRRSPLFVVLAAQRRAVLLAGALTCAGVLVAAAAAAPASAAAPQPRKKSGVKTPVRSSSSKASRVSDRTRATAQVDGITSRVVDQLMTRADRYWHEGDYARVVEHLRVAVEADPQFVDAYQNGAWLLWSMGNIPAADEFLRLGVSRNPNRYDLYTELGQHLFRTRRHSAALPYLQAGTRFKNAPAPAWAALAHCYERVGRTDDALSTWRQIVRRFPDFVAGPPNLRRVEQRKRDGSGGSSDGRPG